MELPVIADGNNHLVTLRNCGGYYCCPTDDSGKRLGPLVGYAGRYKDEKTGESRQWVGNVYVNFAKAEAWPHVLNYFAECLAEDDRIPKLSNLALCGAPMGGLAFAWTLGTTMGVRTIMAEKKVVALATPDSREETELVFARHEIVPGESVIIVEDVCNNLSTTEKLIKLICDQGASVPAIMCFLNRSLKYSDAYPSTTMGCNVPIISLVRVPINEWKQGDPAVAEDVAKGNVVWKAKDEWARLMRAMRQNCE